MAESKIEWTDHTLNPIIGCSPISIGCDNCYARRMAPRLAGMGQTQYDRVKDWDGKIHYLGQKWFAERVAKVPSGKRIFVGSMGDLFHHNVNPRWRDELFEVMASHPDKLFLILTKRELPKLKPMDNLMMGVTAETQELEYTRVPNLIESYDGLKFVSHEPLLDRIDVVYGTPELRIIGGETGPGCRWVNRGLRVGELPIFIDRWFEWVSIINIRCRGNATHFFFKQAPGKEPVPEKWKHLDVQEFPDWRGETPHPGPLPEGEGRGD